MSFYYYEQLKNIISEMRLNLKYKNVKINLIDHLPYLKEGYLNAFYEIKMLFRISYIILNNIVIEYPINNSDFTKNSQRIIDIDSTLLNKIGRETNALFRLETILLDMNLISIPNIYEILEICIKNTY